MNEYKKTGLDDEISDLGCLVHNKTEVFGLVGVVEELMYKLLITQIRDYLKDPKKDHLLVSLLALEKLINPNEFSDTMIFTVQQIKDDLKYEEPK
jgi:hypothetical protein